LSSSTSGAAETPKYIVESDASIVAPLMFAYVLDW